MDLCRLDDTVEQWSYCHERKAMRVGRITPRGIELESTKW